MQRAASSSAEGREQLVSGERHVGKSGTDRGAVAAPAPGGRIADQTGAYRIAVQDLASGTLRVLSHGRLDESPSFAPNGATLIYSEREGERGALATVSIDGLTGLRLKAPQGEVREPAWGPFSP